MKALVIYDSFFGNTEKVAQSVGAALNAQVARVTDVLPDQLKGIEWLIVGSPTRGFRPTKAITILLGSIPADELKGVHAAAFDTRLVPADAKNIIYTVFASIFGYAAIPIANQLKKKGALLLAPPEGFRVLASEGPLAEGELARAAEWARKLIPAR